jgi:hypothetical protein
VIDDLLIRDGEGTIAGGVKMANGTNSQKDAPFPGTRGKSAALVREFLRRCAGVPQEDSGRGRRHLQAARRAISGSRPLLEVLDGKRVVHHHTHRHDDIMTVLRLREEFGFRVVLHHVSEAWKVADEIAARRVRVRSSCSTAPGEARGGGDLAGHGRGARAGRRPRSAFHTDDWITDSRSSCAWPRWRCAPA